MTTKSVLVLRHVGFEDLGSFAAEIERAGFDIRYRDVDGRDLTEADALAPSLVVVLGGPVGVYDADRYPFLRDETGLLRTRLEANLPTLGVCLGAQLVAHCLGAVVRPMGYREIGWEALALSDAGRAGPLAHLDGTKVLHWHGDTFDIPSGCTLLAGTPACANQAFARESNLLALQFHPEVLEIERWLVGHAAELSTAGIEPQVLRAGSATALPALAGPARAMMREWLDGLTVN